MTRVNFLECLQQFWTTRRVDVALRKLMSDVSVHDIVAGVGDTNIIGNLLFFGLSYADHLSTLNLQSLDVFSLTLL